jgi:putative Mg2+ transporter-C (MgtC) family protein
MPLQSFLSAFWSEPVLDINIIVFMTLAGALLLGLLVGYERSYRGRAAGMRTYGLVCMASAALTVIGGYPEFWYGGQVHPSIGADPTRIIQGIVTGIGFLGAGVIMRDGFNISGLTTAASIWLASVIGVLIGVGFYPAGILLALLAAGCMAWVPRVAGALPARQAVTVTLCFARNFTPDEHLLREAARNRGYEIAPGTLSIHCKEGVTEWHFVAVSYRKNSGTSISELASQLASYSGVESFQLAPARN